VAAPYSTLAIDIDGDCYRWGNAGPVVHGVASEQSALLMSRVMGIIQKVAIGWRAKRAERRARETRALFEGS